MSEPTNGNASKGTQAYRWLVMGGLAIIGILSVRQLDRIEKSADKVDAMQGQVIRMEGTIDGIKVTVDGVKNHFEGRLGDQQRQINAIEGRNSTQDRQLEELQRQQWQRR